MRPISLQPNNRIAQDVSGNFNPFFSFENQTRQTLLKSQPIQDFDFKFPETKETRKYNSKLKVFHETLDAKPMSFMQQDCFYTRLPMCDLKKMRDP